MSHSETTAIARRAFVLFCAVIAVAALYFAQAVLLPFALAILISFLLAPLVTRLGRWGLHRVAAVLVVVVLVFSVLGMLGFVVARQVYDLADQFPRYKGNVIAKVEAVQGTGDGVVERVSEAIGDVRKRLTEKTSAKKPPGALPAGPLRGTDDAGEQRARGSNQAAPSPDAEAEAQPVPVEVVNGPTAQQIAQNVLEPLMAPLGTAAMVVVFVIFMLIERERLRNRLILLIGSRQLHITTQVLDDAAQRVSRYLRMQLLINSAFGVVTAVGLYFIGLPNALLWGVLATALRFLPYIGPWIAAALPILVSLAVFEGWTRPLLVVALFVANELVSNNLLEPWLYGSSTGISTMGVLVSAVFWTWLWGPVGLVMATPLTVCLVVLGRYVPHLSIFHTLLSDEEGLSPDARFYQRLLALDLDEATDIAEEYLEEHSLVELYDEVLLPALSLAEQDRHQGDLDETKQRFILKAMRELVEEIAPVAAEPSAGETSDKDNSFGTDADVDSQWTVLCLPARDEADEIVGTMLERLLAARGIHAEVISVRSLSGEMLSHVAEKSPSAVVVSALPPLAAAHARYLCKRLRPAFTEPKIVVGMWRTTGGTKKTRARLMETGIDRVVGTLAEAVHELDQMAVSRRLLARADA